MVFTLPKFIVRNFLNRNWFGRRFATFIKNLLNQGFYGKHGNIDTARHDYWVKGKGIFKTQEMSLIA